MGKTVVLVGHTCSGKTAVSKALTKEGFRRIAPYTTRPIREGEVDGVDYNFISEVDFQQAIQCGFFAEHTVHDSPFGKVRYGSAKYDYNTPDNTVIVLDPKAVSILRQPIFLVWLDPDERIVRERARKRGFTEEEINRRIADENKCFDVMVMTQDPDLRLKTDSSVNTIAYMIVRSIMDRLL